MQTLIDSFCETLFDEGFSIYPDTLLFYRITNADTFFYIHFIIEDDSIDILYGIVPSQNDLGSCAAIHDFSSCLKFSCLIKCESDVDSQLAEAETQIRKIYTEYSSSTPEQLKVYVSERRKQLYSIATEFLTPYKFEYHPATNKQSWTRPISPDISIEFRVESSPALKHNGLICIHDRRNPNKPQLYWRNAHVNGKTHIFWEDMDDETIFALTQNALKSTILPLIELDISKLLAEDFFNEDNGWHLPRQALADTPLLSHITNGLINIGMTCSVKYKTDFFMRINPSQAFIANIYDSNGNIQVIFGLKHDAVIFDDGIDWLAQVGGAIETLDPAAQAIISNEAEADSAIEEIRIFIEQNMPRKPSFINRLFDHIKNIFGRLSP